MVFFYDECHHFHSLLNKNMHLEIFFFAVFFLILFLFVTLVIAVVAVLTAIFLNSCLVIYTTLFY